MSSQRIPSEDYESIRSSFDDETGIATITLDRPDKMNAISTALLLELQDELERLKRIDNQATEAVLKVVVLEGAGDAFSVGGDIDGYGKKLEQEKPEHNLKEWEEMFHTVHEYVVPVIAKIDGYCLGGGLELATAADFRLASESSKFGLPEIHSGMVPSGGGMEFLPEIIGPSRTKELSMFGDTITAETAAEDGLVNEIYSDEEFEAQVREYAETLAERAPLGVRAIKDGVNVATRIGYKETMRYDQRTYELLQRSEDYREGIRSFLDDRDPEWTGR